MSELLILGAAGFIGSNLANYAIQNTKFDVSSVDALHLRDNLMNLAPAMSARTRHNFYLNNVADQNLCSKILKLEKPKHIIYNCFEQGGGFLEFENFIRCVDRSEVKPESVIILLKDFYKDPLRHDLDVKLVEEATRNSTYRWYVISTCEIFGPRQKTTQLIPNIITNLLDGKEPMPGDGIYEILYVRDLFFTLLQFLDHETAPESGKYKIFSGQSASENDILLYFKSVMQGRGSYQWDRTIFGARADGKLFKPIIQSELTEALEHTASWYNHNKWARN
jgi:dTDP-D-glucose 4,6-dehydratase